MSKQVVYTCITGGYDKLREPKFVSPSIDYICFTDNAKLTSNFWKIRQLPSDLKNLTDVKKQRLIKVLPHKYLSEYDVSLWVDSNIEIVGDLKDFFNKYDLSQKFLYTNKHPSRDCLYREQIAVLRLKKDTYENTNPQIERYREEGFPEHYGLAETNIILRAHKNQKCKTLMNLWGEEILNGSHRDQLSFNYAIWKTGTKDYVEYLDEKYYNLHLSDNNFFKLATHIKADSFERFKTIDTNPPPEPEPIEEEKTEEEYHEEESLPIVEEEPKKALLADPICVVMFTHNRTHVATAVIKSLVRNIVYPNIKWIISDDRSNPGHVEKLCELFREMRINPIVCRTDSKRWGLGASMNNGLREAFKHSDIVLRTEDDWYLEKKLYLEPMVDLLKKNDETAGIRLGMVGKGVGTDSKITLSKGYKSLTGSKNSWIFNNQVMLVHKRTHDLLGWYKENIGADAEETEFKNRFNEKTDGGKKNLHLFCPNSMKWETLDDPSLWFIHIGRSTLGHQIYREPARYSWIYKVNDPKKAKDIKEKRKKEQRVLDNRAVEKILNAEKKEEEEKESKKYFKQQQKEIKLKPTVIVEKQKKQEKENTTIVKKESKKIEISKKEDRICIYTCLLNCYDSLVDVTHFTDQFDFICFTDDLTMKANGWTLCRMPNEVLKYSIHKQQRLVKMLPHIFLPKQYKISLYIDSNLKIISLDLYRNFFQKYPLDNEFIYINRHPERDCLYDEAIACKVKNKDDPNTIDRQIARYRAEGFPPHFGLFENNILLRKHNDERCIRLMNAWARELIRGSRRDQLGLTYCQWKLDLHIGELKENTRDYLNSKNNFKIVPHRLDTGITIGMCNYNTTKLTNACVKSIIKNSGLSDFKITILDNSDKEKLVLDEDISKDIIKILDNTNGQYIDFQEVIKTYGGIIDDSTCSGYANLRHSYGIQYLIDRSSTSNFILFDNDTILRRKIDFIDSRYISISGFQNPYMNKGVLRKQRFLPFLQYFNKKMMNYYKICYFNPMKIMNGNGPNSMQYDTGASFAEAVTEKYLPFKIINVSDYIDHLMGGSWAKVHNEKKFLEKNKQYYS